MSINVIESIACINCLSGYKIKPTLNYTFSHLLPVSEEYTLELQVYNPAGWPSWPHQLNNYISKQRSSSNYLFPNRNQSCLTSINVCTILQQHCAAIFFHKQGKKHPTTCGCFVQAKGKMIKKDTEIVAILGQKFDSRFSHQKVQKGFW